MLIRCISQPLGFAGNRPIAACIIYKCLLQWRSFEVERTSVFDRIIQTIGHAIEVCGLQIFANCSYFALHVYWNFQLFKLVHLQKIQDNNDMLAYWLSNASTLLLLLQRTLKASGAAGMAPLRRRSSSATLFGRMSMSHVKDSLAKKFNLHFTCLPLGKFCPLLKFCFSLLFF